MEMKTMVEGLISGTQLTSIRNTVVHSICDDVPCLADYPLPACCQQITAGVNGAMPSNEAPTSICSAGLTGAPAEELEED